MIFAHMKDEMGVFLASSSWHFLTNCYEWQICTCAVRNYLNYLWWRPVSQKTCRGPFNRSESWSWKNLLVIPLRTSGVEVYFKQLGSNLLLFCFQWSLSLDLKIFSDGASTTSEVRLFHEFTTLWLKELRRLLVRHLLLYTWTCDL